MVKRITMRSSSGSIHKEHPGKPVCPKVKGDSKSPADEPFDLRAHPKPLGSFNSGV